MANISNDVLLNLFDLLEDDDHVGNERDDAMASIAIKIPGIGENAGESPIVILGPNGSGKTKLAQRIARENQVCAISAQRRTWVDDNLPVQEESQLRSNVNSMVEQWKAHSWRPTEEINYVLSSLVQDHTNRLTERNEQAIISGEGLRPVDNTNLILLQSLWNRLFPTRKLEIGGFFPKVKRLDVENTMAPYQLREMSDGERTVLYMAARVMTSEHAVILVDEPELHMHSRLAVQFWDEIEKLHQNRRFVYVTHDLNFTLSRRQATVLIARSGDVAEPLSVDQIPSEVATEVLGAATLPFFANRIFFYEGEARTGFASEFFSTWFDDNDTFAIPSGGRDSVCAAVSGLKTVGVVAAEIIGLVDRDFYPDSVLDAVPDGIRVLPVHEIESVLCDQQVITAVAEHLGKDPATTFEKFLWRVREEFQGQTFNSVVARRVRARVGDLLDGAFTGAQVAVELSQTSSHHSSKISELDLPGRISVMFSEESERVQKALSDGGADMLVILPGKHLLSLLSSVLGLSKTSELTGLVVRSIDRNRLKKDDPLMDLGCRIETAISAYLPPRLTP